MTLSLLNRCPVGCAGFAKIRRQAVYVDKTAQIFHLAHRSDGFILLRPPRFDKSLLINTLASLFRQGLAEFQDLAIASRWKDKTYPVVTLRFGPLHHFRSEERFAQRLNSLLIEAFWSAGFRPDTSRPTSTLDQLASWLDALPVASLVILIDDYDAPLAAHLNRPDLLAAIGARLSELYAVLKQCENCLRFFFMTGVTRLPDYGLADELNHLTDLTFAPEAADLLGFTREEVARDFAPFVATAAKELSVSSVSLLDLMEHRCGGFVFSPRHELHLLSPSAVPRFFNHPEDVFEQEDLATPLLPLLTGDDPLPIDFFDAPQAVTLAQLTGVQEAGSRRHQVLFAQTGVLTGPAVMPNGLCLLCRPNEAMTESIARALAHQLFAASPIQLTALCQLPHLLSQDKLSDAVFLITTFFERLNTRRFCPATNVDVARCLLILLIGGAAMPSESVRLDAMRHELKIDIENRSFRLTLRFLSTATPHPDADARRLLEDGIQSLRDSPLPDNLVDIVLVYSERERKFVCWQVLTSDKH